MICPARFARSGPLPGSRTCLREVFPVPRMSPVRAAGSASASVVARDMEAAMRTAPSLPRLWPSQSVRNMQWFEVVETRGHIQDGKVAHWQVTVKVGFTLE